MKSMTSVQLQKKQAYITDVLANAHMHSQEMFIYNGQQAK
jgi:hypothetical protein